MNSGKVKHGFKSGINKPPIFSSIEKKKSLKENHVKEKKHSKATKVNKACQTWTPTKLHQKD